MPLSPRTLRPSSTFSPKSIPGLALWLDASDTNSLYTTDAGPVTAVSSPTDIAGCVLWLDGADSSAASMTLNGSLVETWNDKSGSNNNATASGAARPTLTSGGLNGKSVVTFDGTANAMQISANAAFNSNDLTYFVVFKQAAAANKGVYTKLSATAGTNGFGLVVRSDPQIWLLQKNANASQVLTSTANPTTQARIYTVTSSSTAAGYLDGLSSATAASTADHSLVQRVMVGSRDSSEYLNGYVAEVIHYNRVLTRSELAQVEAWLAAKWGVPGVHAPATATSDPVGAWLDKSGNARHATQSTAASRPTISATALNGRRQLGLVSQHLRGPSTTWAGSVSIYWVGKTGQAANGAIVFGDGTVDQTDSFHAGWLNTQGVGAYGNGWGAGNAPRAESPSAWRNADIVAGVTLSSTESVARVNGATTNTTAALTGSLSQSAAAQFYIGRETNNTWNNISGTLAELLIYQPALNASQRLRIERHLAAKYGITLAPQVSNPDAQDWVNRVYANGGTVSSATASAVNTFCDSITNASLRDRFYRLNLFCGTGLNAALVPLYRGPSLSGTQYGNTTDTNNGPFVSGDYSESTGLLGNGSSKYLNTGFDASAAGLSASGGIHLSVVVPTYAHPSGSNWIPISITNSAVNERFWININSYAGNTSFDSYLGQSAANFVSHQVAATNGAIIAGGLWTANRSSSTDLRLYSGSSQQGATQTGNVSASVMPTLPLTVFARWNGATPFGYFGNGSVGRIMAYSAGLSMTSAQLTSFNNAMSAFNSALARNV